MNPFPSPLLCLYCDKIILPGDKEGCRKHMFECRHHPAKGMQKALNQILGLTRGDIALDGYENVLESIDKLAEDALR